MVKERDPFLWSVEEIANEIADHIDDHDWIPHQLIGGGYVVKTLDGRLVPAPITKQTKHEK